MDFNRISDLNRETSKDHLSRKLTLYCCWQGQLCGSMPVVLTETKMRMILQIKITLPKSRCKNDVGASPSNVIGGRHYFYE